MPDFTNQIAVVTGASSGIGKAIALKLAAQGALTCLVGRRVGVLEQIAKINQENQNQFQCYHADLLVEEDIQALVKIILQDFNRIDLLVHSAGEISFGRVETAPVEDLDRQYRINVRAPYILTQALLPLLKVSRGQIVFINSSVSLTPGKANSSQYCATKLALKAIADSLRDEMNAEGIRVMSIYPGRTASLMQATIHKLEGKPYHPGRLLQPEDIAEAVVHALGLPRTAEVTDISIRPMIKP